MLQRTGEAAVTHKGSGQDESTYKRITHRLTYICGTQIVWLDAWDSNEDGHPDAQRTHERDAIGRLVHEKYSGTPRMDDGPLEQTFRYDCHRATSSAGPRFLARYTRGHAGQTHDCRRVPRFTSGGASRGDLRRAQSHPRELE